MATRLYLQNATPGASPSTDRGAWDSAVSKQFIGLSRTKSGALVNAAISESSATGDYDVLMLKAVSEPVPAQTISGTVDLCVGALESHGLMNAHWHLHIYVTQGNTDSLRGTLLTDYTEAAGTNEWPATAAGHVLNAAQTLSSLAISENDRIVVELGYVARNTSSTTRTGTLWYGGTGSDLTAGGDETTLTGWVEFSGNFFPATVEGAASLPAAATVTAAGTQTLVGAAAMAGSAAVAALGGLLHAAAASLTGSGTTAAVGTATYAGQAAASATGAMSAAPVVNLSGAGVLAGSATLAAAGTATYVGAAAVTGSAAIGAVGALDLGGLASLAASAVVAAVGTVETGAVTGAAVLAAGAVMAAAANLTLAGAGALAGSATMAAAASAVLVGAGALSGTATVAAAGNIGAAPAAAESPVGGLGAFAIHRMLELIPYTMQTKRLRRLGGM